jgi:hypothetical protein
VPVDAVDITATGVSCTAPDDCVLVGRYRDDFTGSPGGYAGHWDGSAWTEVTMAGVPYYPIAEDVTCTSSTDCTAVGGYATGPHSGSTATLVEHFDGSTWSVVTSPNPPTASPPGSSLTGVTCTSAVDCVAVGSWIKDASTRTLVERLS